MMVCVPVTDDGQVAPGWGRARRVAIGDVRKGRVTAWRVFDVGWDRLHDESTEGGHHARVATFLRDNGIAAVAAQHMGEGMRRMLERMAIEVRMGATGDARRAALAAAMVVGTEPD